MHARCVHGGRGTNGTDSPGRLTTVSGLTVSVSQWSDRAGRTTEGVKV